MRLLLTIIFVLLILPSTYAAFDYPAISAHNAGLASSNLASTIARDGFMVNPALSVNVQTFYAGLNYFQLFNLKELAYSSGQVAFSFKGFGFGAGIQTFGATLYRENKITLNSSRIFLKDKLAIGFSVNIYNISVQNYDGINAFGLDLGFRFSLSENWHIAGVVENINQPKLNGYSEELPNRIQFGFEYRVAGQLYSNISIQKDAWFDPAVLVGVEYNLSNSLGIISGFSSAANLPSGGINLNVLNISISYSIQHHFELGPTHFIGIAYNPRG
jgi:hypothetical protein